MIYEQKLMFYNFLQVLSTQILEMAKVQLGNVVVLDNPSPFLNPFQFEVTFECIEELKEGKDSTLFCLLLNPLRIANSALKRDLPYQVVSGLLYKSALTNRPGSLAWLAYLICHTCYLHLYYSVSSNF